MARPDGFNVSLVNKTKQKAHSVRCTNCHAPIELFGNQQRSKIIVCGYCGTAMDIKNEFRALYAFTHVEKPSSRLRIGMRANIKGVEFIISAFVIYESLQGETEEWVEYQLYAEKYGYAYMMIRGEKCCFLRKTYHLPSPNIWLLSSGDSFTANQQQYTIEQFYLSKVLHSEGALLENIKQDKRDKQCFARIDDQYFYSKYSVNKVMYFQGEYMKKEQLEGLFS